MAGLHKDYVHERAVTLFVVLGMCFVNNSGTLLQNCQYSILPALDPSGIIYSHIKVGSYNGDQFLMWFDGLLAIMNPYPLPRRVLVIDNSRIHHIEGVEERCKAR